MTELRHQWKADDNRRHRCITCGVLKRSRPNPRAGFPTVEYLVSGEGWTQLRPACFVPGAEQSTLFGEPTPAAKPVRLDVHECVVTACNRVVPTMYLMCGAHWRLVPETIQYRVTKTWNSGRPLIDYREAREAAIAYVDKLINLARQGERA